MRDQVFIKTSKRESKRKRLYIISIICLVFLCIIGVFVYFFYWSSALQVVEFSVNGVNNTEETREAVLGYFDGIKSFFSPAHDRIVFWMFHDGEIQSPSFLPSASSIRLTSNFNERKVIIDVVLRVMSGVWCTANRCFVFDKNGVLFDQSPDVSGSLILKIRDENNTPVSLGNSVLSQEEFQSMKQAIESVERNKIPISEIVIQNRELKEWATVAPNGFSVRFSFDAIPEDLDSVFKGIFERTQLEKLTYIDLRVPNRVYFK